MESKQEAGFLPFATHGELANNKDADRVTKSCIQKACTEPNITQYTSLCSIAIEQSQTLSSDETRSVWAKD
jgi:hypothetical protein